MSVVIAKLSNFGGSSDKSKFVDLGSSSREGKRKIFKGNEGKRGTTARGREGKRERKSLGNVPFS